MKRPSQNIYGDRIFNENLKVAKSLQIAKLLLWIQMLLYLWIKESATQVLSGKLQSNLNKWNYHTIDSFSMGFQWIVSVEEDKTEWTLQSSNVLFEY